MDINNLDTIPVEIIDTRPETEHGRALKQFMLSLAARQKPQMDKSEASVLTPGQQWEADELRLRNPHTFDADIQRYMDMLMEERRRPMPEIPPLKNIIKEEVKRRKR